VLFLPWLSGSLAPEASPSMRGGFLNLSLDTRRVDLVRAMIEGTAHNLRWLLPALEGFTGQTMDELAFYGGAARSSGWAQILADILDRPVQALGDPDFAVARAMALIGLERTGNLDGAVESFVRVAATYEPDPANRGRYDAMHEQFVAAFEALKPICESLNG
jgi:xylulokinase